MTKISAIALVQTTADLPHLQFSWEAQTFDDWEGWVVGPPDLLARLTLKRSWQPLPRPWGSWASAVNAVWQEAQGEYLAFWSPGDRWLPLALTRLAQALDDHPTAGLVFSRVGLCNRAGKPLGLYPRLDRVLWDAADLFCDRPIPTPSCTLVRRSLLPAISFTASWYGRLERFVGDERLRDFAEEDLWLRIVSQTAWQAIAVPEGLVLQTEIRSAAAEIARQEAWEQWLRKVASYAPHLLAEWEKPARAQRYWLISRRAQGALARQYAWKGLREHWPTVFRSRRNLRTVLRAWGLAALCPPPRQRLLELENM